jgi:hypothetical protein
LGANLVSGKKAHDIAVVYHQGVQIANFGIRRGSNREAGHDHIPQQIFVSSRQARLLGQCPMSRDEWIKVLRDKGIIEE